MQSRYGSSTQRSFAAGSDAPQYYGLALPGPLFLRDVLPTEYVLVQSLVPKFSVILGKITVITIYDRTLFADSFKSYFANFNFNKNPMALNFYNTTSWTAVGVWTPTNHVLLAGGVLDPNSQANNFTTHAFARVNIYGASISSYSIRGLPGQSWAQFNWTDKPKIDLGSPFGQLSPGSISQAVGVLVGGPATEGLPLNFGPSSWVTIENFSQYLLVKDSPGSVVQKLKSGQPLRGVGLFGRAGYGPESTNTVARQGSIALFGNGLSDRRPNDSFGMGFYYNGTSRPLKDDVAPAYGRSGHCSGREGSRDLLRLRDHSGSQSDPKLPAHLDSSAPKWRKITAEQMYSRFDSVLHGE